MRIAYRFHPDSDFMFRGVMRACFSAPGQFCRLSTTDVAMLCSIVASVLWLNAGALTGVVLAASGVFLYMIAKICARAAEAVLRVRPRPMPVDVEIEPGAFIRCTDRSEEAFTWETMMSAEKYDDMYVVTFRVPPATDRPVLIARAQLNPDEDAALERALPCGRSQLNSFENRIVSDLRPSNTISSPPERIIHSSR